MVTVRILLAMTALVASPVPTKAQWNIENHFGNPSVTATEAVPTVVGGCGGSRLIHATRQPPFRQPGECRARPGAP